ncbi:MAG: hypothetical protein AAGA23_22270 [Pseudomonadota bacterium]
MGQSNHEHARLLARLGGKAVLPRLVQAFYFYVFRDEEVGHFFAGVDSERVMRHQEALLALLLADEPPVVTDYLSRAHARLVRDHGLTHRHFDVVCWLLLRTLRDFELDTLSILEVSTRLEGLRTAVLAGDQS